ncbi:hypothetical protein K438DRAFT_194164 [Mycena galopus ATCC 62051]|nr:hypothetical protein K438DRAFT_194164 [Mycena galopus ATCC 62051]
MTSSGMRLLVESYIILTPHPLQTHNKANSITSPSSVVARLGDIREEMGVEVYSATQFLFSPPVQRERRAGQEGVRCGDARRGADAPAYEVVALPFRARATLLAEGAHTNLSKHCMIVTRKGGADVREGSRRHGGLRRSMCLGCVALLSLLPSVCFSFLSLYLFIQRPAAEVLRTPGWPLSAHTYGGGWEYQIADDLVSIGLVVGLDYKNQDIES